MCTYKRAILSFNLSNILNFISTFAYFLHDLNLFWKKKYFKALIYDSYFLFQESVFLIRDFS